MLIIALLITVFDLASGAPPPSLVTDPSNVTTTTTLSGVFGHELVRCAIPVHHRTVQDIVRSCLTTIFACTWVAVHPNTPRQEDSGWLRLKQRVLITVYAVLAPEFIIIWALRQRIGAAKHTRKYNERFHSSLAQPVRSIWCHVKSWFHRPQNAEPNTPWTLTHGFLLEMYGMVNDSGAPITCVSGIPSALGISEVDIKDKSKGDFATGLFVLLQTTWFIVQCLARWITRLPVTELEIVTLAFALLNVGTCMLWWNKPQNMGVAIQMDRYYRPKAFQEENGAAPPNRANGMVMASRRKERGDPVREQDGVASEHTQGIYSEAQPPQDMGGGQRLLGPKRVVSAMGGWVSYGASMAATVVVTVLDLRRLQFLMLRDILHYIVAPVAPLETMATRPNDGDNDAYFYVFYSSETNDEGVSICFLVVGTLFGGLHLMPLWLSSFPSSSEDVLWRLSVGLITITPSVTTCLVFFRHKVSRKGLVKFTGLGIMGLYLVTRVIIITLSFTTLRDLPSDAFRDVAWAALIPHFQI